ncbi:MAG: glutamate racemase [Flavobacteriales bacterium]|nr:glutamate racemase [Flavobacteriales bacterium]
MHDQRPIGIFDSGIGGLTVTAAIQQALPRERLLYFGDTAHMPYGQRSLEQVRQFSEGITAALLERDCKLIVVACNTASGAALKALRARWPMVPFVGMEPAVKPAAEHTRSGVVGVIATTATFQTEVYASVVERFAHDVRVLHQPCPGLVTAIEAGELDTPATEALLRGWLEPMLAQGIDALVLGCTHYPIVRPLIERILGPGVRVIDPAPAVARQVGRLLVEHGLEAPATATGDIRCTTSGDPQVFSALMRRIGWAAVPVEQGHWSANGTLTLP